MRKEKTEDIHINFRDTGEILLLIDALEDRWNTYGLDRKGINLLIILEDAIGLHHTKDYLEEQTKEYKEYIEEYERSEK